MAVPDPGSEVLPISDPTQANNLALARLGLGEAEAAVDLLRQAISKFPDSLLPRTNLAYALKYDPRSNGLEIRRAAEEWARRLGSPNAARPSVRREVRLKIGYISPDFRAHPVGFFLDGVLACHDPAVVDVYCYSNSAIDGQGERLRGFVPNWRDIQELDDGAVARLIRTDGIHVLVDLAGHTSGTRLPVFAWQPAPVTANWVLGGAGTTGLAAVDYVIADAPTIPPDQEKYYVERVVRLPRCYLAYCPPGNAPDVRPAPSLASGKVTFGCFNNLAKVNRAAVAVWSEILKRCDGSRLAFETTGYERPDVQQRLRSWVASEGVDPSRLVFGEGRLSQIEFLERHASIDIGLDPFPYTGGMTTCDSLWMGVPVITLPGQGVHARHGATILANAGLDFCVAGSRESYVDRAVDMASNIPRLADLRARLRPHVMGTSLCNVVGLTKELEALYGWLWDRRAPGANGNIF